MFDPFHIEQSTSKCPVVMDYRNGKFQLQPSIEGIETVGLLLDHNYLMALARWKGTTIEGPAFILFPDDSYFQGTLSQGLPQGLCTFGGSSGARIHFKFQRNGDSWAVQEDANSHSLHPVALKSSVVSQLFEGASMDHSSLVLDYSQNPSNYAQKAQTTYRDLSQLSSTIKNIFGEVSERELLSYQQFIRLNFGKENKDSKLQINNNTSQLLFKLPASSIVCRLQHQPFASKLLGYHNSFTNKMECSRRNMGNGFICESIGQQSLNYLINQRPPQCLNAIHLFYRQSLEFVNQYFPTDSIYRLRLLYGCLNKLFSHLFVEKQAHLTIQRMIEAGSKNSNRLSTSHVLPVDSSFFLLAEAKNDIKKAVRAKSFERSRINTQPSIIHDNPYVSFLNQSYQLPYKPYKQTRSPQRVKMETTPKKVKVQPHTLGFPQSGSSQGRKALSKYAYLSESRSYNTKRLQNIETLTKYYEDVEKSLRDKKESPQRLLTYYPAGEKTVYRQGNTPIKRKLQFGMTP